MSAAGKKILVGRWCERNVGQLCEGEDRSTLKEESEKDSCTQKILVKNLALAPSDETSRSESIEDHSTGKL